jgi:ribonucleotide reductase alpha subunit
MKILKRNGTYEKLSFDKILYRIRKLANDKSLGVLKTVDPDIITQKVVKSIYDGISSWELDEEAARISVGMTENQEYPKLAARLVVSNLHKSTIECFSEVMEMLYEYTDESSGRNAGFISDEVMEVVRKHKDTLNYCMDFSRDYAFDYFGFKTLERSYLLKINKRIKVGESYINKMVVVERPQHMYLRVALGLFRDDIPNVLKTYDLISRGLFTFASPTLFNSGLKLGQLSSCFTEDTLVSTVNRGVVQIRDIKIGDEVITHKGNVKKVIQLHKNKLGSRKLYEINISKTVPIKITDNHKLYALTKESNYSSPSWISVNDLKVGDYISIPNKLQNSKYIKCLDISQFKDLIEQNTTRNSNYKLNINENSIILETHWEQKNWNSRDLSFIKMNKKHLPVNRFWEIDENFAKFIGIFYGDGHIITGKNKNGNLVIRGIGFTIHKSNIQLVDYCKTVGNKIFGTFVTIHHMKNQNITQVLFHSNLIGEIFKELFGMHFNKKKLWTEMWKWNKNMIKSFLEGLITTDGCITKSNLISIQMSNVSLMRDLYYLCRNNNIDSSYGNERKQKGATTNHVQINIPIHEINKSNINKIYQDNRIEDIHNPTCKNQYSPKVSNGFKFLRFNGKKEITQDLPEWVYTLGIEDDHSYNIGGIIAENCFLLGTEDSLSGIFKTITDCAKISKVAGGIGVHVSNIRSKGSLIRGTHGTSDGIIPMLKVYNDVSLYVNQCLVPETIVYSRRGPLMMKEVEIGDDLITSDGTFQTVQKIFTNEKVDDDLVCISVKLNEADSVDLKCTSVHYIMVQVGNNTDELLYVSASDILHYFNNGTPVKMFFPSTSHLEFTDFIVRTEPHKRALKRLQSIIGTQLLEITNVTTFKYTGLVYDFTVNWNHNYLTEGGIVHNSGKRKGSIAIYLEPWNGDIYEFLDLKKNQGHDNVRARDLFYALWIPDLFMKCVEEDADWYLMCPDECPGLHDSYGEKFEELYNMYVEKGRYKKKVRAQDLWFKILEAQIETGTPYMLYKDTANRKSNQRAYGTIRSSNLCVHGDTLVLTDNGYHKIAQLEGSKVNVWNGWEWSSTIIYKTGENQKLLRVKLSDGSELKCTPYHKFYNADKEVITAEKLKCGTELLTPKRFPVISNSFGPKGYYYCPYTNGYICGESNASDGGILSDEGIPINESIVTRLQWLDGFFDGYKLAGHTGLTFKVKSVRLLTQLRLLMNTLGISPNIKLNNDNCGSCHDNCITFTERHVQQLISLGLRIKPTKGDSNLDVPPLSVVSVEDTREYADTFCFTEEKRGMGIFNGILTGQCSEIILYSDSKETSVCNLSSIALPKFVNRKKKTIDWEGLKETARYIVKGMNRVIDVNYYSVPEAEYANKKHRPIGIGVQGLNDLFILMRYPFESEMARKLNREVFEAIYYGCVEGSIDEAEVSGPYETYNQSPMAEGKLQFDLWGEEDPKYLQFLKDSRWDWDALKGRLKKVGIRNCMLTTCMPTASTAQILGNTECIEPIDSCIFKRRVLSGDFTVINKYLVEDLQSLGLWSNEMKERIILNNGSIQAIQEIPDDIKALYKTVWEISQKTLIEYSQERGPFIDHSQSLNLFVENPTIRKLSSMHFYGWKRGLKTGMYYLRSKSSSGAAKFSVDASLEVAQKGKGKKEYTEEEKLVCSIENKEACEACSG